MIQSGLWGSGSPRSLSRIEVGGLEMGIGCDATRLSSTCRDNAIS